jgi:universal stress protein A
VIAQRGADAHRDAADLCEYLDRSLTEAAEAALAEAQTVLPADAMETTIMGQTGTAICNLAREHRIDLIVIGSHDKSFWHRLVDPSIGRYLIENAPCAVLVVR